MKAAILLTVLLLAAVFQDSEAGFFRRVGRRIKSGLKRTGERIRDRVRDIARDGLKHTAASVLAGIISRGKRSTGDGTVAWRDEQAAINTVDIAKTFTLDLPLVEQIFREADENGSGDLDGQEVLVFMGLIDAAVEASGMQSTAGFN